MKVVFGTGNISFIHTFHRSVCNIVRRCDPHPTGGVNIVVRAGVLKTTVGAVEVGVGEDAAVAGAVGAFVETTAGAMVRSINSISGNGGRSGCAMSACIIVT